ncbi:enoyl-CoA hydratase/isomerase family protein [Elusimicrobiota bacterium]
MIKAERKEDVFEITLSRPPLNILNIEMMGELQGALKELDDDPARILVFRSDQKAFSAGADLKEHLPDKVEEMIKTFDELFLQLHAYDGMTVACVNGAALGGGCELALFCDVVLASEKAKFGQPEMKLGVFPPVALAAFPVLYPQKAALDMILSGELIKADEAHRQGFVNKVLSVDKFDEEVAEYLARFGGLSGSSFRITKQAYKKIHLADFPKRLEAAQDAYLNVLAKTPDATEGLVAFMEKRKPVWGRETVPGV